LLVLFLVPSSAAASWYTCMYDNVTRSKCCCSAKNDQSKQNPAAPEAVLRAACCCTVTHVARAAPMDRANPSATSVSIDVTPVAFAVTAPVPAPSSRVRVPMARPRALDPPDTLLSRRCLLLL
jgi:hypothetical protein